MTQSNQERLANLKRLLAEEKAGDNSAQYIEDLEASIAVLEKRLPNYVVIR